MATSVPIDSLPVELLTSAFERVLDSADTKSSQNTQRYIMSAVSRDWANIIRDTPSLWVRVDDRSTRRMNSLALTRSKECPLEVSFRLPHDSFEEVCQHYQRWRIAKLTVVDRIDDLEPLLEPAPVLEEIAISTTFRKRGATWALLDLFKGEAPSLRRLSLEGMAVPWDTPLLTNLRCLRLEDISYSPPSAEHVIAALVASPQLSVLELRDIGIQDSPRPTRAPPIRLPQLTQLSLVNIPTRVVNRLLQLIIAPPCETLTLQTVLDETVPIHRYIPNTLPSTVKARILLENGNVTYSLDNAPDHTLDLDLDGHSTLEVLRLLLNSPSPIFTELETRLTLITNNDEPLEDFEDLINAFTTLRITELFTDDLGPHMNRLLKRLSNSNWLFPELTSVSISLRRAKDGALAKMVKARHTAALGETLPKAFETLAICEAGPTHEVDRWAVIRKLGAEKVKAWNKIG